MVVGERGVIVTSRATISAGVRRGAQDLRVRVAVATCERNSCKGGGWPMFVRDIIGNPMPAYPHCHCATITTLPGGDVMLAWYAYPETETRDGILMCARRNLRTQRFEGLKRLFPELNSSLGNPTLFCDPQGRVHLMFVALHGSYWDSAKLLRAHSDDEGTTWSTPQVLQFPKGTMVRHPPVLVRERFLVLPAYDESDNRTVLLRSGLDADEWTVDRTFDGDEAIQASLVRQSPDELTMLLRPCGEPRRCLRRISGDDGRSWSTLLRTPLPNPLSGLAGFQVGSDLCLVYNHTEAHQRWPLSLSWSNDRGVSWKGPLHIDDTQHELSYPAFVVDAQNVAHGVYTFGRNRIRYVAFNEEWWRG